MFVIFKHFGVLGIFAIIHFPIMYIFHLLRFIMRGIESIDKERREFIIKPKDIAVVKLYRNDILYFDSLTIEKAEAKIKYTINENELPPPPPNTVK